MDDDNVFMRVLLLALARELRELGFVDVFPGEFEWIFEELKKYGIDLNEFLRDGDLKVDLLKKILDVWVV